MCIFFISFEAIGICFSLNLKKKKKIKTLLAFNAYLMNNLIRNHVPILYGQETRLQMTAGMSSVK